MRETSMRIWRLGDDERSRARRIRRGLTLALATLFVSSAAVAESRLLLPYPEVFDDIKARTYDGEGREVGSASISVTRASAQSVIMSVETRGAGSARNMAWAELATIESQQHGNLLRLLRERSESFDEQGHSLGLMQIDHVAGRATCGPPHGSSEKSVVFELPEDDRVTNVPLNLLFLPLVQGQVDQIDFQLFLCRGGPRVLEFAANIKGERPPPGQDFRIVEVEYRPELGRVLSLLARGFVPNLSFWYDANGNGTYLAHRMPLFSKGPEVTIVRDGISPQLLEFVP